MDQSHSKYVEDFCEKSEACAVVSLLANEQMAVRLMKAKISEIDLYSFPNSLANNHDLY
jgi:hypothetical protein